MSPAATAKEIAGGSISGSETWKLVDSPFLVQGDVTVEASGALTLEPGVELVFAKADALQGGSDTAHIELTVKGKLTAEGSALQPIKLHAQSDEFANVWHGIVIDQAAISASLKYLEISEANNAVSSAAPGSVLELSHAVLRHNFAGLSLTDGAPIIDSVLFTENAVDGIYAEANAHALGLSLSNCVFALNGSHGLYLTATATNELDVTITSSTFHGNISSAIASRAFGVGTELSLSVQNSIFSSNGIFGIDSATTDGGVANVTATYSDFYLNGTDLGGADVGEGCIFVNPSYLDAPDDLRIRAASGCIDTGSDVDAPALDLLGRARPQGDGVDMGAYEYTPGDVPPAPAAGTAGAPDGGESGAGAAGVAIGGAETVTTTDGGESDAPLGGSGGAATGGAADGVAAAAALGNPHHSSGCGCRLARETPDPGALGYTSLLGFLAWLRRRARPKAL